jgi:Tfp pilus assembly protein PilX
MTRFLRREDGIALVMSLITMAALTIGATTAIYYAQSSGGTSRFSKAQEAAYHSAEGGLAAAIGIVKNPNNNAGNTSLFGNPQATTMMCIEPSRNTVGGVCPAGQQTWATYTGVLNSDPAGDGSVAPRWELTATGYAYNPTGAAAAPLKRTVGAYVSLAAPPGWTSNVDDSWSYLFSTQLRSVSGACDQTYTTNVSTLVYSSGNLCVSGANGALLDPNNNNIVEADGQVTLASTTNWAGADASHAIKTFKTNYGCKYNGGALTKPCPNGSNHSFYSNSSASNQTTDGLTPPVVDWDGWYQQASPGPRVACQAAGSKSTAPSTWPTFDTNTLRDNSVPTVVDLTPATAYTCWTENGEIAWDPATKTMLIYGTVFIDGSAKIANGVTNIYKGWGTIYLSGTFYMSSGTKMCAWTQSSGNCNTFYSLFAFFVIATNGVGPNQGGLVPAGDGTKLAGSTFQGWMYSANNIEADASATVMGPMIGNQLIIGSNVVKWSSWGGVGPSGAPGNTPNNSTTQDPSNFTG